VPDGDITRAREKARERERTSHTECTTVTWSQDSSCMVLHTHMWHTSFTRMTWFTRRTWFVITSPLLGMHDFFSQYFGPFAASTRSFHDRLFQKRFPNCLRSGCYISVVRVHQCPRIRCLSGKVYIGCRWCHSNLKGEPFGMRRHDWLMLLLIFREK